MKALVLSTLMSLPSTQLTVMRPSATTVASGQVSAMLVDPQAPSCELVKTREAYLRKQISEVEATTRKGQLEETLALRQRLLTLQQMLSQPWAKAEARFSAVDPAWLAAIAAGPGHYAIAVNIAGREWRSAQGYLPDGISLVTEADGSLNFSWTWDAYEFCFWQGDVEIRLELPQ